jgi:hypothetical protein
VSFEIPQLIMSPGSRTRPLGMGSEWSTNPVCRKWVSGAMVKLGKVVILRAVVVEMGSDGGQGQKWARDRGDRLPTRRHMAKGLEEDIARRFPATASRCNLIRRRKHPMVARKQRARKIFIASQFECARLCDKYRRVLHERLRSSFAN